MGRLGHARFKRTKRRAEAAVAGDLLEKVADSADVELLRQEVRRARVEMEVEAVLVVGMRVLEIVGHPDDRRELKFVRGIEIGVADAAVLRWIVIAYVIVFASSDLAED